MMDFFKKCAKSLTVIGALAVIVKPVVATNIDNWRIPTKEVIEKTLGKPTIETGPESKTVYEICIDYKCGQGTNPNIVAQYAAGGVLAIGNKAEENYVKLAKENADFSEADHVAARWRDQWGNEIAAEGNRLTRLVPAYDMRTNRQIAGSIEGIADFFVALYPPDPYGWKSAAQDATEEEKQKIGQENKAHADDFSEKRAVFSVTNVTAFQITHFYKGKPTGKRSCGDDMSKGWAGPSWWNRTFFEKTNRQLSGADDYVSGEIGKGLKIIAVRGRVPEEIGKRIKTCRNDDPAWFSIFRSPNAKTKLATRHAPYSQ